MRVVRSEDPSERRSPSQDGVVYQTDFGPNTLDEFKKMEPFNPDESCNPVLEDDQ
jgi:hypothetical protein